MQLDVDPIRRVWNPMRRVRVPLLAAMGILQLSLCNPLAQGQSSDSGGLSQQNSPPVEITPAPANPTNAPLEPLFPQATAPQSNAPARSPRYAVPNGPASGAGLGFGPIRAGDIVEVQIFDAPEYSVRMPVSAAGQIAIPYAGLFHIEGMTSIEAANAIAKLFVQNQILRDPRNSLVIASP
jgi:hypothetical protein